MLLTIILGTVALLPVFIIYIFMWINDWVIMAIIHGAIIWFVATIWFVTRIGLG